MKSLVIFQGLLLDEDKCSDNIFINLIEPNMHKYNITIVFNTSYEYYLSKNHRSSENKLYKKDKKKLEDRILGIYNKYNNIKDIYYYNLGEEELNKDIKKNYCRLLDTLVREVDNEYDLYVFLRPDIILNKVVDFDKYLDGFCFITSDNERPCIFHNRDWSSMGIGGKKPFKIFWYLFFKKVFNYEIIDSNFKINYNQNLIKNFNRNEYIKLAEKIGLKGTECLKNEKLSYFHYLIYNLYKHNYIFSLSDTYKLFSTIIR